MEEALQRLVAGMHPVLLAGSIAAAILVLAKSADWLVDGAVMLSARSGIPKVIVGATIVSLGTTAPEAAVSVLAAVQGSPGLALGNAVGSIICDTGLILGLASILAPLPLTRRIVNRQGWVQLAAGASLVLLSWPWNAPGTVFSSGGRLPQTAGFLFVAALAAYIIQSIRWAGRDKTTGPAEPGEGIASGTAVIVLRLLVAMAVVLLSAQVLIVSVAEAAGRMHVPDSVIAATLVAFGTSLPELVTAVRASLRGHGELAVGNVIGADILNVLFVAGTAAAVTPGGLLADEHFFRILYPTMLFVLLVFRIGIVFSGDSMRRPFGIILLATYGIATLIGYVR